MAIKRWIKITCDGPCGTVIEGNKVPEDWSLLQIANNTGQIWTHREHLCPQCLHLILAYMKGRGYSFVVPQKVEPASQPAQPITQIDSEVHKL